MGRIVMYDFDKVLKEYISTLAEKSGMHGYTFNIKKVSGGVIGITDKKRDKNEYTIKIGNKFDYKNDKTYENPLIILFSHELCHKVYGIEQKHIKRRTGLNRHQVYLLRFCVEVTCDIFGVYHAYSNGYMLHTQDEKNKLLKLFKGKEILTAEVEALNSEVLEHNTKYGFLNIGYFPNHIRYRIATNGASGKNIIPDIIKAYNYPFKNKYKINEQAYYDWLVQFLKDKYPDMYTILSGGIV